MRGRRVTALLAAGVAALAAFLTLIAYFDNAVCIDGKDATILLVLASVVSLGFIWVISEPVTLLLETTTRRWSVSPRVIGVAAGVGCNLLIGLVAFGVEPAPGNAQSDAGLQLWIPFWVIGVLYEVGALRQCF